MDSFKISKQPGPGAGFHVEGFPEAVALVKIDGPIARRLNHLALHRNDLLFASQCLLSLATGQAEPVRSALWIGALVHYFKCFGQSNARGSLDQTKIYAHNPVALESFTFFKNMRDKHYVHDANPFAQSTTGAVINGAGAPHTVAKIVTFTARDDILDQAPFTNLRLLIEGAESWVAQQYDAHCDALTKELERRARSELLALPSVEYTKADPSHAGTDRK